MTMSLLWQRIITIQMTKDKSKVDRVVTKSITKPKIMSTRIKSRMERRKRNRSSSSSTRSTLKAFKLNKRILLTI